MRGVVLSHALSSAGVPAAASVCAAAVAMHQRAHIDVTMPEVMRWPRPVGAIVGSTLVHVASTVRRSARAGRWRYGATDDVHKGNEHGATVKPQAALEKPALASDAAC